MAQYCKYCAHCIEGDCFFCTYKEKVLGDKQIHHTNKCNNYVESELGSIIDGKQYKPRRRKTVLYTNQGQKTVYDLKVFKQP